MNKHLTALSLMGVVLLGITACDPPETTVAVCDSNKIDEILDESGTTSTVSVNCHLDLEGNHVVKKKLILEGASATGVHINCHHARLNKGIVIASRKYRGEDGAWHWERPENITVKNCYIKDRVDINSMSNDDLREPAKSRDFVATVRNNAPRRIIFDQVTIETSGRIPLYLKPGVTEFSLINSEIKGRSTAVAIYLDHESSYNIFKNNYIHTDTDRELVAVDGSSHNIIINNKFSSLNDGGIYLYRNCGERGVIRHTPPEHNQIINNIFYYNRYQGGNPSIYVGSRNGKTRKGNYGYCGDDEIYEIHYDFGSSADDRDFARYNAIMQNQIYKRSISDMIISKNWENNSPNYIDHNQTVTAETVRHNRPAGCYVANGYRNFILHGESISLFIDASGRLACTGEQYTCDNGELIPSAATSCDATLSRVRFDCQVSGDNNGCRRTVSCPSGERIITASAACNLEYGTVTDSTLAGIPANQIKVVRPSDNVSDGYCYIGSNSLKSGEKTLSGIDGLREIVVGCKEHDRNGGDCHIKGTLYCH